MTISFCFSFHVRILSRVWGAFFSRFSFVTYPGSGLNFLNDFLRPGMTRELKWYVGFPRPVCIKRLSNEGVPLNVFYRS